MLKNELIHLARCQAEVCNAQAAAALTTLALIDDAADVAGDYLRRRLAKDAANNLRSVLRTALAALDDLEGSL